MKWWTFTEQNATHKMLEVYLTRFYCIFIIKIALMTKHSRWYQRDITTGRYSITCGLRPYTNKLVLSLDLPMGRRTEKWNGGVNGPRAANGCFYKHRRYISV